MSGTGGLSSINTPSTIDDIEEDLFKDMGIAPTEQVLDAQEIPVARQSFDTDETSQIIEEPIVQTEIVLEEKVEIKPATIEQDDPLVEKDVVIVKSKEEIKTPKKKRGGRINLTENDIVECNSSLDSMRLLSRVEEKNKSKRHIVKIIALQSGYSATVAPVGPNEMFRLSSSSLDSLAAYTLRLKTIYGSIVETSLGRSYKFEDWLKVTASEDVETFCKGIHQATYPGNIELDITCPHCSNTNKIEVSPDDVIQVCDESVYEEIQKHLEIDSDFKGLIEKSPLRQKNYYELPESAEVVQISIPSIYDQLMITKWGLSNVTQEGRLRKM